MSRTIIRSAKLCLASWLVPAAALAELSFREVILDPSYIAYERDVGDIDGDGDLDIGFTAGGSRQVRWARNPGDGTSGWSAFTVGSFPEADWPDRCEAADLNGDGRVDLIATEENSGSSADALACWWEQPAAGATSPAWPRRTAAVQYTMNSLDAADVDRDGDVDLVLAEHRGTRRIAVWENDGTGGLSERLVDRDRESHLGGRNGDASVDIGDPVGILLHLFASGPADCEESLESNGDGAVDIADPIYLLGFLFLGGAPPGEPYPEPGADPEPPGLGCERS